MAKHKLGPGSDEPTERPLSTVSSPVAFPFSVRQPASRKASVQPAKTSAPGHPAPPVTSGHGNPPGRSIGIGGPGGGAFPSPSPAISIGGPAAPPQRINSVPSMPPHQQSGGTPGVRPRYPDIESQLKTLPITLTSLVNEVKGIYVGLAMVESKCIEIDNEQSANNDPQNKLEDDQWQALLALHRTLLHEHHDFMLASQHPSASPALRRVAQKYAMPARMWRHGIHSFLELLRHRLPASREHMITFIYMAYSIIALLYETVRAFEDTWVECLGDLSRYRMAIEDDNQRVRDTWTSVSRRWYSLASDRVPTTGRLHHHLAILARPFVVTQLYYYVKSLCVPIPFTFTRESIMTLLDPVLNNATQHVPPIELDFTKAHAILFKNNMQTTPEFSPTVTHLLKGLDAHITLSSRGWTETGVYMAIVNSCSLLSYGGDDNVLMKVLRDAMNRMATEGDDSIILGTADKLISTDSTKSSKDVSMTDALNTSSTVSAPALEISEEKKLTVTDPQILKDLQPAQYLVTQMDQVVFSRVGDANCNGYIHARLVCMLCMARLPEGMVYVKHGFPWEELVVTLNHMLLTCENYEKIEQETFMQPQVDKKAEEEKNIKEIQFKQQQQQQAAAAAGDNSPFVPTEPPNVNIPDAPPARSDDDKPLPDDWYLRGLLWSEYNFPQGWFANMDSIDDDEKLMETASTRLTRKERVLWMACRLATFKTWITYDAEAHTFSVTETFRTPANKKKSGFSFDDAKEGGEDTAEGKDEEGAKNIKNVKAEVKNEATDAKMFDANDANDAERDDGFPGLEEDNDDADDDSDTADFEEEDGEDTTDDVNLSDMEGIAREKVSRFNQDTRLARPS